jgi:hypothetical protein
MRQPTASLESDLRCLLRVILSFSISLDGYHKLFFTPPTAFLVSGERAGAYFTFWALTKAILPIGVERL